MTVIIRPMDQADLDAGARLLAARHRSDRARTPVLSPRFEDSAVLRPMLEASISQAMARGAVAERDGTIAAFLLGGVALPPPTAWFAGFIPPRSAQFGYAGHAAGGADGHELYRRLYAALAPYFLEHGCFAHFVEVNAEDEVALDAWFSLGFGRAMTLAVRDTAPGIEVPPDTPAVEIHQADAEDIDVVMRLNDDLMRHHNASPTFLPYLEETLTSVREHQLQLLNDPANAHWVAYRDGLPVGMQTFHEQTFAEMARPDRSIYLFQGVTARDQRGGGIGVAILDRAMQWARDAGHERCTLHFLSANIPGARFWLRTGFRPLTHLLVRRIDDRIAWAHGRE